MVLGSRSRVLMIVSHHGPENRTLLFSVNHRRMYAELQSVPGTESSATS